MGWTWMRMGEDGIPNKMLQTKIEENRPKGRLGTRWIDQIRKDIETRGGNWEGIQGNKKWEIRDGWRFLCNSRPIFLETT